MKHKVLVFKFNFIEKKLHNKKLLSLGWLQITISDTRIDRGFLPDPDPIPDPILELGKVKNDPTRTVLLMPYRTLQYLNLP